MNDLFDDIDWDDIGMLGDLVEEFEFLPLADYPFILPVCRGPAPPVSR